MKRPILLSLVAIVVCVTVFLVLYNLAFAGAPSSAGKYAPEFVDKVKWQIENQWYWARVCERISFVSNGLAWFLGVLVVILSATQINMRGDDHKWIKVTVAALVPLVGSIAAFNAKFDFGYSQKVHEEAAREYDYLYDRLKFQHLPVEQAVEEYRKIHAVLQKNVIKMDSEKDDSDKK